MIYRKMTMKWLFSFSFFVKLSLSNMVHSIPLDPKHSIMKLCALYLGQRMGFWY